MNRIKVSRIVSVVLLLSVAAYGQVQNYSVANGGVSGLAGDDVWTRIPVPPTLNFSGAAMGYEVDAISQGMNEEPILGYEFSVDLASAGLAGSAVAAEAVTFDQQADIYRSTGAGSNVIMFDGDGSSAPTLGLVEQPGVFGASDNVDGWENDAFQGSIYYSYNILAPAPPGLSGADICVGPSVNGYDAPPPAIFALAGMLGLDQSGARTDDIDALVVFENGNGVFDGLDFVLFSLTRTSMALSNGSAYNGFSAADVFFANAAGVRGLQASAASLGLNSLTDDIDALDVIPEPSVLLLLLVAGGGMGLYRRVMGKM